MRIQPRAMYRFAYRRVQCDCNIQTVVFQQFGQTVDQDVFDATNNHIWDTKNNFGFIHTAAPLGSQVGGCSNNQSLSRVDSDSLAICRIRPQKNKKINLTKEASV